MHATREMNELEKHNRYEEICEILSRRYVLKWVQPEEVDEGSEEDSSQDSSDTNRQSFGLLSGLGLGAVNTVGV